jgi:hypothetical protein
VTPTLDTAITGRWSPEIPREWAEHLTAMVGPHRRLSRIARNSVDSEQSRLFGGKLLRCQGRREALGLLGAASAALAMRCGGNLTGGATPGPDASLSCVATPAETEGPYFVDELLQRSDLTSGTNQAGVLNGLPLLLRIGVYSVSGSACTPLSATQVDIWHADACTPRPGGRHTNSPPSSSSNSVIDSVFASAPYNARGTRDTRNTSDSIYNAGGRQLLLPLQPASSRSGYEGSFDIGLRLS